MHSSSTTRKECTIVDFNCNTMMGGENSSLSNTEKVGGETAQNLKMPRQTFLDQTYSQVTNNNLKCLICAFLSV